MGKRGEFLNALNFATSGEAADRHRTEPAGSAFDRVSGLLKGTLALGLQPPPGAVRLSFSCTEGTLHETTLAQTGTRTRATRGSIST